jgi:uncharacterized repeat protein (TIGR01451 family)
VSTYLKLPFDGFKEKVQMKTDHNPTDGARSRIPKTVVRFGTIALGIAALMTITLLPTTSATSFKSFLQPEKKQETAASENSKSKTVISLQKRESDKWLSHLGLTGIRPLVVPPAPFFFAEEIATFEADCSTPRTAFTVGDTVCLKATGFPAEARKLYWINPDGAVIQVDSSTEGTRTVAALGNWRGYLVSGLDGTLRVASAFSVSDPAQPRVDLSVVKSNIDGDIVAGGFVKYQVTATNNGPDAAANVQLVEATPNNTAFVSASQDSGPTFTCTENPTNSTCTLASMASGASATFTFIYQVNGGVLVGSEITNTASVSSDTTESHSADNSVELTSGVVSGSAGAECSLDCPNNIVVTANTTQGGENGAVVTFGSAEAFGDCGAITTSVPSGSFFPVGSTTVVVSSANGGGSCSFQVIVTADAPPNIDCPANISRHAANCEPTTIDPGTPTSTPSGLTVEGQRSDGLALDDPYPVGVTTITWTATDAQSRQDSCTQTITVTSDDTEDPTITAPENVTIATPQGTAGSCGLVIGESELGQATAADNCTVNVTRSGVPAGNFFPVGTTTVTYTATDGAGHTASATQTVTVTDGTSPIITAPADASYVCQSEVPAGHPSQAHGADENLPDGGPVTDNCGTPTVTVSDSVSGAGSAASPKIITRTFTATDAAGNSASAVQTITVIDPTAPTIAMNGASPMVVECHSVFTDPGATATDNCNGTFAATATSNVDANVVGNYTITYTASDAAGNAATPVVRNVTVVDTTAPVIALNGANPMVVECHTVFTDPGATATDGCTGSFAATANSNVNANVVGNYTVTYTATDASGNAATPVVRNVTVVDTTAPIINLNGQTPSLWPPNHKYSTFNVTNFVTSVSDSCNTTLGVSSVVIEKVTSDETENGNGDGNTDNDMIIAANCKSVQLRAERQGGGNGRVYTIHFKVTDASGNVGRATANVLVPHNNGQTPVNSGVQYTVNGTCP